MDIQPRNPNLKYPLAIRDEKTLIELDWLLEFRFSTSEILARRIGQTAMNINRFLNKLADSKLIHSFSNSFASKRRLYMLAADGIDFLESHGRNVDQATTRQSSIGKFSSITHDLQLQKATLERLSSCKTIHYGRHLSCSLYPCKPDLLMLSKNNDLIAADMICHRKAQERIIERFHQHAQAIQNKQYGQILHIFSQQKDLLYYQKLFNKNKNLIFENIKSQTGLKPNTQAHSKRISTFVFQFFGDQIN